MKRTIALFLAVMLLVAAMPVAAFADSTKTAYISRRGSGSINMLKGPGYDYAYTGNYVKHNDKVTVKKASDGWAKITVKRTGKTGWIRNLHVFRVRVDHSPTTMNPSVVSLLSGPNSRLP